MELGEFLGLPLPVVAAFVAFVLGLALLARQLHRLGVPTVSRPGAVGQSEERRQPRDGARAAAVEAS